MIRHRTGAAAIALLALVLAGCENGGGDPDEVATPTDDVATSAPVEDGPTGSIDETGADTELLAALLTEADFPVAGWVARPDDPEPYVDEQTGGICTFDLTDALPADVLAAHVDRSFSSDAVAGILHHGLYEVPDAEAVVAELAAQVGACSGAYPGADAETEVSVTSSALSSVVPGAAVSVCRYHETTFVGQGTLYGPWCLAATGDRLVEVLAATPDPAAGIAPDDFEAVLTAITAKAFTG